MVRRPRRTALAAVALLATMVIGATPAAAQPEVLPPFPSGTRAEAELLVARHQALLERLASLEAEGGTAAAAVIGALELLVPAATGDADVTAVALVDSDLRATYDELLAVRQQLAALNPGPAHGIGIAVFPVGGTYEFVNSWGAARSGGRRHKGTDILAPEGTELYAIESGVIERFSRSSLGGLAIYLQGDSGARYYYAHLSAFGPQAEGDRVDVGELVGYVGDTGNARGTPHLHFQFAPDGGERWVNPYPLLVSLVDAVWPSSPPVAATDPGAAVAAPAPLP